MLWKAKQIKIWTWSTNAIEDEAPKFEDEAQGFTYCEGDVFFSRSDGLLLLQILKKVELFSRQNQNQENHKNHKI